MLGILRRISVRELFSRTASQPFHPPALEKLEPRILLSGDGLLSAVQPDSPQDTLLDNTQQAVQCAELWEANEQVERQCPKIEGEIHQPLFTLRVSEGEDFNEQAIDADLSPIGETGSELNAEDIGPSQTGDDLALLLDDSDVDRESLGTTEDGSMPLYINDADLGKEYATSIEIRGPPASETVALSGMHLVGSTVHDFDGQVVYLDFDGQDDVTYDGPVTVQGIDVPGFVAPGDLAGQEHVIITEVLGSLEHHFEGSGVIFTTERPSGSQLYSTIYIGGDDSAFGAYGSFLGLAEQIDIGNQDRTDGAFVFTNNLNGITDNSQVFARKVAAVIAHETLHLLGYQHDNEDPNGGVLSTVALDKATNPDPADGSIHQSSSVTLSWTAGDSAVSHDIYLGENFADVDAGTGGTFQGNQTSTTFVAGVPGSPYPGGLVVGNIYYWRIDAVNPADPSSPWKGDVWSFTVTAPLFGGQSVITTQADTARDVYACDLDGDGDNDILSASASDDKIAWYENQGGGTFGSQQVISTQGNGAASVYA